MSAITPRPFGPNAPTGRPFDATKMARDLLVGAHTAALATLDPSGFPFCTATNVMLDATGAPVFFAARLALHARNIEADPRVSLTLADMQSDVMVTPRLTLSGQAVAAKPDAFAPLKIAFQARFPKSKLYLELPDAALFRVAVSAVQLNGGPGQNRNALTPQDLGLTA